MRRKFSLFLAALMVFAALAVACQTTDQPGDGTGGTKPPVAESGDGRLNPDLEIKDLDGYCFAVFGTGVNEGGDWNVHDLLAAEGAEGANAIDEGLYKRNMFLEDTYNFSFTLTEAGTRFCRDEAYTLLMAGDQAFDDFCLNGFEGPALAAEGMFLDMNELPYLDFEKDYWTPSLLQPLTVNGRLFTAVGDISIVYKQGVEAFYFNKTIAADKKIPSIYQLVYDDQWTYEKLFSFAAIGTTDLNGDTKIDANDCYGIQAQIFLPMVLFQGSGEQVITKDDNDEFVIGCDSDRAVNVIQTVTDYLKNQSEDVHTSAWQEMLTRFNEGKALFYNECMLHVETMRGYDVDFGIIPAPKYNEEQDGYHHLVTPGEMYMHSLPFDAEDPDRSAYILEVTAVASKFYVTPAYYDVSLKNKYTRDEESKDMLDIIFSTVRLDAGNVYGFGRLYDYVTSCIRDGGNIASIIGALKKSTETAIQSTLDQFESNYYS